ncbi:MAG: CocE/NonD family hydrolase C-terminal non-catalytic domain-containing protein [Planctomycetota bacterium]|nr:CocE/NonD family hydrolase C-terminal non-catalytic domain-containing protein [Planctomycetota bacterium]
MPPLLPSSVSTRTILGSLFMCTFLAPVVSSQCTDPTPSGGLLEHFDLQYTQSDGYITLVDVRIPDVTPGPCGWPTVLFIHGVGFDRKKLGNAANMAAMNGYLTITYDVRGQGDSMLLNDPSIYGRGPLGLRERMDLFEVLEETKLRFSAELDMNRVGVTGKSQGAFLTWAAAAHSGRVPPLNPWRTAPFPIIHAAAPQNFPPDLLHGVMPQGRAFTEMHLYDLYHPKVNLHNDPLFMAIAEPLIFSEDFAGLLSLVEDPELDVVELLKTSSVPVRATLAFDDIHFPPNLLTDIWNDILPGTPKLLNLSVGGHSTPDNRHEQELRSLRRDMWFDYFLKGNSNGIDTLPQVRMAIRPQNPLEYRDTESLWNFREFNSWPPPSTDIKFWLSTDKRLLTNSGPQGLGFLYHLWNENYTIRSYIQELPNPSEIQAKIPIDSIIFETKPLPDEQLICGQGNAKIWVSTPHEDFQLHIALLDVAPTGESQYIAGGFTTIRGNQELAPQALEFPLDTYSFVIKKGHRLRVVAENLINHRPPGGGASNVLRAVPVFDDFVLQVHYGGAYDSWVSIPFLPTGEATLVASEVALQGNTPADLRLEIHTDSNRSGLKYVNLVSASGSSPGFSWSGTHIPLNSDWLTNAVLNHPDQLPISGFSGTLDQDGRASVLAQFSSLGFFVWPFDEMTFASVIYSPGLFADATNAVILPVR